jgi:hypothetical protein
MNHLILIVVFTMLGFVLQGMKQVGQSRIPAWAPWLSWGIGALLVGATSFVIIDQDKIGHLKRVYFPPTCRQGRSSPLTVKTDRRQTSSVPASI